MAILTIRHVTTYHYRQPVAFGEHRMMLRPRDDDDQKVRLTELDISPAPSVLAWSRDTFGNHVATAHFAERAAELRFQSTIRLDHAPAAFHQSDIDDFARTYPFVYAAKDRPGLVPFVAPSAADPEVGRWAAGFLRMDGSADTHALLVDMTRTIKRTFKHIARHERGIQEPAQTLKLTNGSCRDLAVFMIAALRGLGFAARFVSGYLHLGHEEEEEDDRVSGGNTMPGCRSTSPARAGSTSIRRAASLGIRTWCGSPCCMNRARRSRCKGHGSEPPRTISP